MWGLQSCPVRHNQRPFCQCNAAQVRPIGGPGNTKHSQSVHPRPKAHAASQSLPQLCNAAAAVLLICCGLHFPAEPLPARRQEAVSCLCAHTRC